MQANTKTRVLGVPAYAILVLLAVLMSVVVTAGCSTPRSKNSVELNEDIADVTVPGVPPTFPPTTQYDGSGLSDDANVLLQEIAALQTEEDLVLLEERTTHLLVDLQLVSLDDILYAITVVVVPALFNRSLEQLLVPV